MGQAARNGMIGIACLLMLATVHKLAEAQENLERQLTGGSSRAWTLQRFTRPPPPGIGCSSGGAYTFTTSHELLVNRCQGGAIVASHHTWSVSTIDGVPTLAITGLGTYSLTFPAGARVMRLHATDAKPGKADADLKLNVDED